MIFRASWRSEWGSLSHLEQFILFSCQNVLANIVLVCIDRKDLQGPARTEKWVGSLLVNRGRRCRNSTARCGRARKVISAGGGGWSVN